MYAPSPDILAISPGGDAALFDARAGELHALNPTAELIWRALAAGEPLKAAEKALMAIGASPGEARDFVAQAAGDWLARGFLAPLAARQALDRPTVAGGTVRIGEFAADLGFHDHGLAARAEPAFSHLYGPSVPGAPTIAVTRSEEGAFLFLDGSPLSPATEEEVAARLKAVITERYAASITRGFLAHGALIEQGGARIFLTGDPGAGKSTLTAAMAFMGGRCLADDIVHVHRDGTLTPAPFALTLKSGSWPLLEPLEPSIAEATVHLRGDGQKVRYLASAISHGGPGRIDLFVRLDRRPQAGAMLEPMNPLQALCVLLDSGYARSGRLEPELLRALAETFDQARCFTLVYSDLPGAVRLLQDASRAAAGNP